MWYTLWLVLIDLWRFAGEELGLVPRTVAVAGSTSPTLAVSATQQMTLAGSVSSSLIPSPAYTVSTLAVPSATTMVEPPTTHLGLATASVVPVVHESHTYYVEAEQGTHVLRTPHVLYDNARVKLPYGTSMTVRGFVQSYAEVLVQGMIGYVLKDSITPHRNDVWPLLVVGERYDARAQATIQLRRIINDVYLGGLIGLPLQASEYVTMRLLQDNITIPWHTDTPRQPGLWHVLLRGCLGVYSSVTPKTDTLMEWEGEDGGGRLAYVEAVLPDGTIRVSAVGVVEVGEYTEALVPAAVWREWRPVFISIS